MTQDLLRWHYSNHYFAELQGEAVLEDILALVNGKGFKGMLNTQLKDEVRHAKLYQQAVSQIGIDERAAGYSKAYSALVKSQKTLVEKVYSFQILTEAVSSGYCQWRLQNVTEPLLNSIDNEVLEDEVRHLKMGHTILKACDPDEIKTVLTKERRKHLQRQMNNICLQSSQVDMMAALLPTWQSDTPNSDLSKLNRSIAKSILNEISSVNNYCNSLTETESI